MHASRSRAVTMRALIGRGSADRLAAIRELMSPDRPMGQALAEGGTLDRLFAGDGPGRAARRAAPRRSKKPSPATICQTRRAEIGTGDAR
jgi:hypothetical protein